jgi:hypothetical protein
VSNVMSWSTNWPKKVVPAVWVGLFGLFTLRPRSVISSLGPLLQVVVRVERTARCAQSAQPILDALCRRGEGGQVGKEAAERRRTRRDGRASRSLSARHEYAAAGDGNRSGAEPRTLQKATPAVARATLRFVNGCHFWKACLRSYFATLRPRTTPATPEKW